MNLNQYISGVTVDITSKIKANSIPPVVVGNAFTNLATIVSASTPSVENGLQFGVDGAIGLGGSLNQPTLIDYNVQNFVVQGEDGGTITTQLNFEPVSVNLSVVNTDSTSSSIGLNYNNLNINFEQGNNSTGININNNGLVVGDSINNQGIINAGDYEPNFVPRSLATVQYVQQYTNLLISGITGGTGVVSAENGLQVDIDGAVGLGGSLNQNTIIDYNNKSLTLQGNDGLGTFTDINLQPSTITQFVGNTGGTSTTIVMDYNSLNINLQEIGGLSKVININHNDFTIADDILNQGLTNFSDYEPNFTPRSLATVQYVTGYTHSVLSGTTPTNGLINVNGGIGLGGSLIGNTEIDLDGSSLNIIGSNSEMFISQINNSGGYLSVLGIDQSAAINIFSGSSTMSVVVNPNLGVYIEDNLYNRGAVNTGDYEPNFTPRSLATVQYVTGYTHSVLSGNTGGFLTPTSVKNGNYNASVNDFIPVDTTTGSTIITLPKTPINGSKVAVKMVIQGTGNTISVVTGSGDTFNKTSGSTTFTLTLLNQGATFQYSSLNSVWYVTSDDLSLGQLDLRYVNSTGLTNYYTKTQANNLFLTGYTLTGTTLLQYNITDAYTKSQTDSKYITGYTLTATTLGGYGISSGDTLFDSKYLNIHSGATNIILTTSGTSGASTLGGGFLNIPIYSGSTGAGTGVTITLTTTGTSGPATLISNVLNIPVYSGGTSSGSGGTTSWGSIIGTLSGQTDLYTQINLNPIVPMLNGYTNIAAAFGVVRLISGATKAIRLRRSFDNAEADFYFAASGYLVNEDILNFLAGYRGYVHIWYDQSGNGNNAVQTGTTFQPYLAIDDNKVAIRYEYVGGNNVGFGLGYTLSSSIDVQNTTLFSAYSSYGTNGALGTGLQPMRYLFSTQHAQLDLVINAAGTLKSELEINTNSFVKKSGMFTAVSPNYWTMRSNSSNIRLDSNYKTVSLSATTSFSETQFQIGNTFVFSTGNTTGGFYGDIYSFIHFNNAQVDANISTLVSNSETQFELVNPANSAINLAFVGDSITVGDNALNNKNYVGQISAINKQTTTNFASAGADFAYLNGFASSMDAAVVTGKTNILFVWCGTNDISNDNRTPTQVYNDYVSYATGRTAAGWNKVYAITMLPRTALHETNRLALNASLVADTTNFTGVIDIGSDPRFAVISATWPVSSVVVTGYDTAYGFDGTHPTTTGYGVVAGYLAPIIEQAVTANTLNFTIGKKIADIEKRITSLSNTVILNSSEKQVANLNIQGPVYLGNLYGDSSLSSGSITIAGINPSGITSNNPLSSTMVEPSGYGNFSVGATGRTYNRVLFNILQQGGSGPATSMVCIKRPATAFGATGFMISKFDDANINTADVSMYSDSTAANININAQLPMKIVSFGGQLTFQGAGGHIFAGGNITASNSITLTNGNLTLGTAGNKLFITTGAGATVGVATLSAGTVTITAPLTANSTRGNIFVTHNTISGVPGILSVPVATRLAGTSFVINSTSSGDTSTVDWWVIN